MSTTRACETCHGPIPERPYQSADVRTCSPHCASVLHRKEYPNGREMRDWLPPNGGTES